MKKSSLLFWFIWALALTALIFLFSYGITMRPEGWGGPVVLAVLGLATMPAWARMGVS